MPGHPSVAFDELVETTMTINGWFENVSYSSSRTAITSRLMGWYYWLRVSSISEGTASSNFLPLVNFLSSIYLIFCVCHLQFWGFSNELNGIVLYLLVPDYYNSSNVSFMFQIIHVPNCCRRRRNQQTIFHNSKW